MSLSDKKRKIFPTDKKYIYLEEDVKEAIKELTPELFHNTYEEVAMRIGWNTNKKCKVRFDDLPETNQETMITTIRVIKDEIFGKELANG